MRMQFRNAGVIREDQFPFEGEPFWDDVKQRMGFFDPRLFKVNYLPAATANELVISTGQVLAKEDSNMTIALNENSVVIKNKLTGVVLAEFNSAGMFVNALVKESQGYSQVGIVNKFLNGSLYFPRAGGEGATQLSRARSTGVESAAVKAIAAPNWMLWCDPTIPGEITAEYSVDVPDARFVRSLLLKAYTSQNCGVSTFIRDYRAQSGRLQTGSIYAKGPANAEAVIDFRTAGGVLTSKTVLGTGKWTRYELSHTLPKILNNVAAQNYFEMAFRPRAYPSDVARSTWRVVGAMQNLGVGALEYEAPTPEIEASLLSSIYRATSALFTGTTGILDLSSMLGERHIQNLSSTAISLLSSNGSAALLQKSSTVAAMVEYEVFTFPNAHSGTFNATKLD